MSILEVPIPAGKNEPEVHPAIKKSFLYVQTAGMRIAPETLILELFRELFFNKFSGSEQERQLNPSDDVYTVNEKAVIYALRGRRKLFHQTRKSDYYAPAYPVLAKHSWLRQKSDRVVKDFFLSGPLSQHFLSHGKGLEEASSLLANALSGHRKASHDDYLGKEFLSVALKEVDTAGVLDTTEVKQAIEKLVLEGKHSFNVQGNLGSDPLAERIVKDMISICELERDLPRIQWIALFKTYIRLAIPVWLIAQMRHTIYARNWIMAALQGGDLSTQSEIQEAILERNLGIFHPTTTPTREIFQHVEDYVRARVELNVILHLYDHFNNNELENKKIVLPPGRGEAEKTMEEVLLRMKAFGKKLQEDPSGLSVRQLVTRICERYPAWKNPIQKGQGKNYDEFLRVLRRAADGTDDGYLLIPDGKRTIKGFVVFPGALLLKTFTYLAARLKEREEQAQYRGKLMLSDIEDHFRVYGIDFSTVASARPQLILKLQEIGLLKGSPDAGESAEVFSPYQLKERQHEPA